MKHMNIQIYSMSALIMLLREIKQEREAKWYGEGKCCCFNKG